MKTILIIDDMELLNNIFVEVLQNEGYSVYSSISGLNGIEKLKSIKTDLILLDIMMPVMDGWETLDYIRSDPEISDIPVIMMTAKKLFPDDIFQYGDLISGYIKKPLKIESLINCINSFFKNKEEIEIFIKNTALKTSDYEKALAVGKTAEDMLFFRMVIDKLIDINSEDDSADIDDGPIVDIERLNSHFDNLQRKFTEQITGLGVREYIPVSLLGYI
ncbi:response regulator [Methanoplanus limicola]|uniref:Response regulator receiver protein n=1 Tax=Methanoplanus limicola DSM 2279 TaxID=937775 RepID=H1Z344_9EURY|nr:response regulator [Methanoplanus limicola]EHQ35584.1 response regulator receiver protein [Methanoplanus limicola DSM 2279]